MISHCQILPNAISNKDEGEKYLRLNQLSRNTSHWFGLGFLTFNNLFYVFETKYHYGILSSLGSPFIISIPFVFHFAILSRSPVVSQKTCWFNILLTEDRVITIEFLSIKTTPYTHIDSPLDAIETSQGDL